ncbi:MAG: hypothetical protein PHR77_05425 [Kiritimatiellae bacterium]|nr:hypothetical protein [Kiritimatiellia bacterium]MDD5521490.1 hypothetical protein [Kiritimatiellia bacterium]
MKKTVIVFYCSMVYFIVSACQMLYANDTLIMKGRKTYEGIFQHFKNDKLYFQPKTGKIINVPRSFAEKLILEPPSQVTVTPRGKKKIEDMKLKGYEKSNFLFEKNGEEFSMPASQISFIEMGLDFGRAANGPAGQDTDNNDDGDKPLIINLKELSAWMKEGTPTPEQTKAFEHYKTARITYDDFVEKSAIMVKAMDKSTGATREDFLNKLRKRKNDEQPLLGELKKAEQELLTAFPEIKGPAAKN